MSPMDPGPSVLRGNLAKRPRLCPRPFVSPQKINPPKTSRIRKAWKILSFLEPPLKARFTGGPPRLFSRATRHFPSGRITPQPIGLPGAVLREVPELRLAIRKSELARFPLPLLDCRNFPCPWETPISRVLQASRTILWNLSPKKTFGHTSLGIQASLWAHEQGWAGTPSAVPADSTAHSANKSPPCKPR